MTKYDREIEAAKGTATVAESIACGCAMMHLDLGPERDVYMPRLCKAHQGADAWTFKSRTEYSAQERADFVSLVRAGLRPVAR